MSRLYVVATPIGNLGDLSERGRTVLAAVDLIACEDTRHTAQLLSHIGIRVPMLALHEHSERDVTGAIIGRLQGGEQVALVSDAGTPLISDPGFNLVAACHEAEIPVVPVPGPSAGVAALSAAGLPTDRFVFEGFLPARHIARCKRLQALRSERRTMVFYEAPHRVRASVSDLLDVFGGEREVAVAREITKVYEQIWKTTLVSLDLALKDGGVPARGEFALVLAGNRDVLEETDDEVVALLTILLDELPASRAANLAAKITGRKKREVYEIAIALKTASPS
jgi:16S rRNA (cytidine1402-2'-O)-methyltransferase